MLKLPVHPRGHSVWSVIELFFCLNDTNHNVTFNWTINNFFWQSGRIWLCGFSNTLTHIIFRAMLGSTVREYPTRLFFVVICEVVRVEGQATSWRTTLKLLLVVTRQGDGPSTAHLLATFIWNNLKAFIQFFLNAKRRLRTIPSNADDPANYGEDNLIILEL